LLMTGARMVVCCIHYSPLRFPASRITEWP
jgi:hypothetical protein